MQARILQVIFLIFLTIAFNACGSKMDESVQNSIQEERHSESEDQLSDSEYSSSQDYLQESTESEASADSVIEGEQANGMNSIDTFIENKISSAGVLTMTELEFDKEIVSRAIQRRIRFDLIELSDREAMIKEMENIMKEQGETYRVVKEKKVDMGKIIFTTLDGATLGALGGSFVPLVGNIIGGLGGGLLGLGYSLKDVVIDKFAKKTNWLISKSPDEKILKIYFVKDQN